MIVCLCI